MLIWMINELKVRGDKARLVNLLDELIELDGIGLEPLKAMRAELDHPGGINTDFTAWLTQLNNNTGWSYLKSADKSRQHIGC